MDTQRLEGSRFGAYPATLATFVSSLVWPKRAKTGGSRERLAASQLYDPGRESGSLTMEALGVTYDGHSHNRRRKSSRGRRRGRLRSKQRPLLAPPKSELHRTIHKMVRLAEPQKNTGCG
jgi:hypothetical protein